MAKERPFELQLDTLAQMSVETVLTRWPKTAPVFQSHKTACLGCPITLFCTIADVAQIYSIPTSQLLTELAHVICEVEADASS